MSDEREIPRWRSLLARGQMVSVWVDGATSLVVPDGCPRGFVAREDAPVIRQCRGIDGGKGLSLVDTDEEVSISCGGATMRLNRKEERIELTSADAAGDTVTLVLDAKTGATIQRS